MKDHLQMFLNFLKYPTFNMVILENIKSVFYLKKQEVDLVNQDVQDVELYGEDGQKDIFIFQIMELCIAKDLMVIEHK